MRVKIRFSKNTEPVPNNQCVVNSYIHNCLGRNNPYHDKKSNYCITRMMGGIIINGGRDVDYINGGFIVVSSDDDSFINILLSGIRNNKSFGYGMVFQKVEFLEDKLYNGWNHFKTTDMGFILKKKDSKSLEYWTLNDSNFAEIIKEHIINKFSKIKPNLNYANIQVDIKPHHKHVVVKRYVKNVCNISNVCQISIFCDKELAKLIYNYGLGQSTGSGFGLVYSCSNHLNYK